MTDVKYIHTPEVHNTRSAEVILPFVFKIISPKSVIDIGCGIGTWLKVCLDLDIPDIKGIDGGYLDKSQLMIPEKYFEEHDLETGLRSDKKYDLVISLEVAEHISPASAEIFVDSLTSSGDVILFSAAVQEQGGQNHVNEQPPAYWESLFAKRGYKFYDLVRPVFWNNENADWWYRQNTFLVSKNPIRYQPSEVIENSNLYIHPKLYYDKAHWLQHMNARYNNLMAGRESPMTYFKLLLKSIFKVGGWGARNKHA